MEIIQGVLSNFFPFLMSILLTIIPTAGLEAPVLRTEQADCLLNMELLSDLHFAENEWVRPAFLKRGLKNLNKSQSAIDGVLICGDITDKGDTASVDRFFRLYEQYSPVQNLILATGNHDIGYVEDRGHDAVRDYLISSYNQYAGTSFDKIYYSLEINGYKFIVLSDEGETWDSLTLSQVQLDFLDTELADGTKDGKPVFVCCHWPVDGTNGENVVWDHSGLYLDEWDVKSICEKYKNVFWISGHIHSGIKSTLVGEKYGLKSAEQINGVTYINLPTFGVVNLYGLPWSGTGAQLEVYENEVVFRPRNLLTNTWYTGAACRFEIVK